MKLLLLGLTLIVIGSFIGGEPIGPTWPTVSLRDDFQSNVLDAPSTTENVHGGLIVFIGLTLICIWAGTQNKNLGYMLLDIVGLIVIGILSIVSIFLGHDRRKACLD